MSQISNIKLLIIPEQYAVSLLCFLLRLSPLPKMPFPFVLTWATKLSGYLCQDR